ncbi:FAD-binding protein [Leucobacter triazinivorans]|uniref:UDP-N-acetylenolpyruvoylglucosamine reductase n=1 Tax=Leucobacter triazinivorans TaxID=1784719 RepID=A0A4P6KIB9_9MICO|nr:FAD-binding protein [Leucobacter triazinivorans]QBE50256.1 FAD-binding protein [Leucobacter triazinivorans]
MRVGGPAERILVAHDSHELARRANELWDTGDPWLLLGGGSNTIVSDEGFPGTVLLVRSTGIARVDDPGAASAGAVHLRVQAGHDWDHLVAACVDRGWSGIEALSGIPGLAGAAPVQNIGAYGQELSDVLHSIEFLDRGTGEVRRMAAGELQLGYRDSAIKRGLEGVVLSIDLLLGDSGTGGGSGAGAGAGAGAGGGAADASAEDLPLSAPIRYAQLAGALGVETGDRVPLRRLREAVLRLRASKGMVLDPEDHDTWSAGSFFTNPIVTEHFARQLPEHAPRFPLGADEPPPAVTSFEELAAGVPLRVPRPAPECMVKLSAAWLIEHAGIGRGFRLPGSGAAISSKHTLAITNRGAASAADVAELARLVVQRVQQEFGVILAPEPNLYGLEL